MPCREQGDGNFQGTPERSLLLLLWLGLTVLAFPTTVPQTAAIPGTPTQRLRGRVREVTASGNRMGPQDTHLPLPSDPRQTAPT